MEFASVAAFEIVASHLARAAQGQRQAWVISVPAQPATARWTRLATHLRVALAARDTTPQDSIRMTLEIAPVRVVGDTLIGGIHLGRLQRCAGTWRANSTRYDVRVLGQTGSVGSPEVSWESESYSAPCVAAPARKRPAPSA